MKRNILFAITLFTLSFTPAFGAESTNPLDESTATVDPQTTVSPKKANLPPKLVFPDDVDSTATKVIKKQDRPSFTSPASESLFTKLKDSATVVAQQGKDLAARIFTYENMRICMVTVGTIAIACVRVTADAIILMFEIFNSVREMLSYPNATEKNRTE